MIIDHHPMNPPKMTQKQRDRHITLALLETDKSDFLIFKKQIL